MSIFEKRMSSFVDRGNKLVADAMFIRGGNDPEDKK